MVSKRSPIEEIVNEIMEKNEKGTKVFVENERREIINLFRTTVEMFVNVENFNWITKINQKHVIDECAKMVPN